MEPLSAKQDREAYRVEKPIRMRIHRSCHNCNTTFGSNKVCAQCQHPMCGRCPRYPVKKAEAKAQARGPVAGLEPDSAGGPRENFRLTLPSSKPGGQPLVRKSPTQRVRRTCHECSTLFQPGVRVCATCDHVRCVDCPRNP